MGLVSTAQEPFSHPALAGAVFAEGLSSHGPAEFLPSNVMVHQVLRDVVPFNPFGFGHLAADLLTKGLLVDLGLLDATMGHHHLFATQRLVGSGVSLHCLSQASFGCPVHGDIECLPLGELFA